MKQLIKRYHSIKIVKQYTITQLDNIIQSNATTFERDALIKLTPVLKNNYMTKQKI